MNQPATASNDTASKALSTATGEKLADKSKGALTGAQKAMLFLVSLDEPIATRVIAHLRDHDVSILRKAAETLQEAPPGAVNMVHREFLGRFREGIPQSLGASGAYLRRLVGNALGEGRAAQIWSGGKKEEDHTLGRFDPVMLAAVLEEESPQTSAVVLSQIAAEKAAVILQRLSPEKRAEVLLRITRLESVPESVLSEIEQAISGQIAGATEEEKRDVRGQDAATRILKRLPADASQALLDDLSTSNAEAADKLKQALFTFEDLVGIDARGMQQLLKEVPTDQLVLALKTASEELKEKVFGNLSSRAAEILREDLGLLGPTKIADVEAAQRALVDIALELERDGRITIAREGGDGYV